MWYRYSLKSLFVSCAVLSEKRLQTSLRMKHIIKYSVTAKVQWLIKKSMMIGLGLLR